MRGTDLGVRIDVAGQALMLFGDTHWGTKRWATRDSIARITDPDAELPTAAHTHVVTADRDGVLERLDALPVGVASWRLGAGRARKEDSVQAGAGVEIHAVPGDAVTAGQKLFTLHTDTPERFERAIESLNGGYSLAPAGSDVPARESAILDRIN